jgi:proline dehydrogenase
MIEKSQINFEDTATAFAHMSNKELRRSHFLFSTMNYPWLVNLGTSITSTALKLHLPVKGIIKKTLFDQFCGGESIADSEPRMRKLAEARVKTILDYSVEGETTEASFDEALEEALRVATFSAQHVSIPFCVIKLSGIGSAQIMQKVQSEITLSPQEQTGYNNMIRRIEKIAAHAANHSMQLMIDAEESWIQNVVDRVCYDLMLKFNKERAVVYNTYQLYKKDSLTNMKKAHVEITESGCFFGAKLVRGAYMEKERARAKELNYPDPIQPNKISTDMDYNNALDYAMTHISNFALCAGTHNEQSCQYLADLMHAHNIAKTDERVYFAQLLGMSDNISFKLADLGYYVAKYVPYGPLEKVLPYLFRRAEENTAIAGQSGREFLLVKKELKRRKGRI